jgi:hypothetical protein
MAPKTWELRYKKGTISFSLTLFQDVSSVKPMATSSFPSHDLLTLLLICTSDYLNDMYYLINNSKVLNRTKLKPALYEYRAGNLSV